MAEEHTETQEQKEAPEFTPITSQADLNRIVKDRLERERKKYADYGELKEQARKYAELKESFDKKQSELAEALTRIGELEEARRVATAKSEIAKEFSIPADALRGANDAELREHAETLKGLLHQSPTVPTGHMKPSSAADETLTAIKQLFDQ